MTPYQAALLVIAVCLAAIGAIDSVRFRRFFCCTLSLGMLLSLAINFLGWNDW